MARRATQKWMMTNQRSKSGQTWVLLSFSHPNLIQVQLNSNWNAPIYTGFVSFFFPPNPKFHGVVLCGSFNSGSILIFLSCLLHLEFFQNLSLMDVWMRGRYIRGFIPQYFNVFSTFYQRRNPQDFKPFAERKYGLWEFKELDPLFLLTIKLPFMLAFLSLKIWFSWVIRMPSRGIITFFGCEEIWPYSNHPSVICLDY